MIDHYFVLSNCSSQSHRNRFSDGIFYSWGSGVIDLCLLYFMYYESVRTNLEQILICSVHKKEDHISVNNDRCKVVMVVLEISPKID